jgi:hypothetical protein
MSDVDLSQFGLPSSALSFDSFSAWQAWAVQHGYIQLTVPGATQAIRTAH